MDHEDAEAAFLVLFASSVVILGSFLKDLHQLCRLLSKGGSFIVPAVKAVDSGPLLAPILLFLLLGVLY